MNAYVYVYNQVDTSKNKSLNNNTLYRIFINTGRRVYFFSFLKERVGLVL